MEVEVIEKTDNEIRFRIKGGSQSLLNVLRKVANSTEGVTFSGFQLEHPLQNSSVFIMRTKSKDPAKVLKTVIEATKKQVADLKHDFDEELR